MSGINNNHYPVPLDDEMKYDKKPSPYCKLMVQKFATAPNVKDNTTIDWNKFLQAMSNADSHLCKLEFNWFKETGSKLTVLTPNDTLIPKISTSCEANLPADSMEFRLAPHFKDSIPVLPADSVEFRLAQLFKDSVPVQPADRMEFRLAQLFKDSIPVQHSNGSQQLAAGNFKNPEITAPLYIRDIPVYKTSWEVNQPLTEDLDKVQPLVSEEREVYVVVHDSVRNLEKTFHCPLHFLTNYMPYFKERLKDIAVDGDIHISVHCDVIVFEKILVYINRVVHEDEKSFKIDPKYVIHLLVSADFLQMSALVEKCLDYCHRHLSFIIQSNGPLAALNDPQMNRLASRFNHREVEAVEDPQGKIKEKLYKNLLERLLKPDVKIPGQPGVEKLFKCSLCLQVFPTVLQELVICKSRKAAVGSQGQLAFYHKRAVNWDHYNYLCEMHQLLQSWRKVYWRIWGLVNCLTCIICGKRFCCGDYTMCAFHRDPIELPEGEPTTLQASGTFPCCGQKAFQYDPLDPLHLTYGCCYRNHSVSQYDRHNDTFQDMITYFDLICSNPNQDSKEIDYDFNQTGLERIVPCFSNKIFSRWIFVSPPHSSSDKKKISKTTSQATSASIPGELTTETLGSDVFVPVLSTLANRGKPFNIKHTWQPRASHWHNQDAVRDHDEAMIQRLMLELQKLQL